MNKLDKIFKAYDVRGVYPSDLNEEIAYDFGQATAQFLNSQIKDFKLKTRDLGDIAVGRDGRSSSEALSKVLIEGIRDQGNDVIDLGIVTVPMFCFFTAKNKLKGGVMVTASHNPGKYNGFKVIKENAMPVGEGLGLEKIKELMGKKNNRFTRGKLEKREILQVYINHILGFVKNIDSFKIVIDTANGVAALVLPELFREVPNKLIHIFPKIDGSFPGHEPNPSEPKNTQDLQKRVLAEKADLGVSFDGDGDRIFFIDENGERVSPDLIGAVIVHYYFKNGGKMLCTEVSSRNIKEEIGDSNNELLISRVGHTFIKQMMIEQGATFGCEPAGHYYIDSNYFNESPFIILLKILEILSKTKMPLSELVKQFKKYHSKRIRLDSVNLKKVEEKYKKTGKVRKLDGLTMEFGNWWFNLRASNTEPIHRLTIEARDKELLEEKTEELLKLIQS